MRFEDLTPEQLERAKKCETAEERIAFIKENGIELTDEQLEGIAGGEEDKDYSLVAGCPNSNTGHSWTETGRKRPGKWLGDLWPDSEQKCDYCGATRWV